MNEAAQKAREAIAARNELHRQLVERLGDSRDGENIGQWLARVGTKLDDLTLAEQKAIGGNAPPDWHCVDCGFDTLPGYKDDGLGELNLRPDAAEWYTVKNDVWDSSGLDAEGGCLCIGCLERRIGRQLRPDDFVKDVVPFGIVPYLTQRLRDRMGVVEIETKNLNRRERRKLAAQERRVRA